MEIAPIVKKFVYTDNYSELIKRKQGAQIYPMGIFLNLKKGEIFLEQTDL